MRSIIFVFSITLIFSCTEQKEALPMLEGVWKRIGTVNFNNGVPSDTVFFEEGKIPNKDGYIEGFHFKTYSKKHFIWFRNKIELDSIGNDSGPEMFVQGKYELKNDSLFEYFESWHDSAEKYMKNRKNMEFKIPVIIDKNRFVQYRINDDGNGKGELWEKYDEFDVNPTNPLVGVWSPVNSVEVDENGQPLEDVFKIEQIENRQIVWIYSDNYRTNSLQTTILDSLGNDTWEGSSQITEIEIVNDSIIDKFKYGLSQPIRHWTNRNNIRRTTFKILNDSMFLYGMNPNIKRRNLLKRIE